ncbi:hypothetical protein ACFWP2_29860 [Kitasatospora sp. NPDC058444]|uniref:hypothetical protein n=1 Tax=Kitasatospora sp. NPDC058444 TaxID=3346504 RepID=UPI003647C0EA
MDPSTPWRNLGFIGLRLADLVIRYAATLAVTEALLAGAMAGTAAMTARDMLGIAAFVGLPSVVICFLFSLFSTRTGAAFRGPLAGLLLLPLWFLLFFPPLLPVLLLGQLLFALCVVRAPLLGPPRIRPLARRLLDTARGRRPGRA